MGTINMAAGAQRAPLGRAERAIPWLLMIASPVIFALLTSPAWAPGSDLLRHLSLPIVAMELVVVLVAMAAGMEPLAIVTRASRTVRIAMAGLTAVAVGTALFVAPDRATAVIRTACTFIHFFFGLALLYLFKGRWRDLHDATWIAVVIGLLCFCLVLAAFVFSIGHDENYKWSVLLPAATNVRQLGFYSDVGASAALGLALASNRPNKYWLLIGAASVLLALSFWSGTRSSLVAIAAACAIAAWTYPQLRSIKALGGTALAFLSGAVLSLLHQVPSPAYGAFRLFSASRPVEGSDPSSGRIEVWFGTAQSILDHPVFGIGESQFRTAIPASAGALNHPHNLFLQVFLQWGLIGGACFFGLAALLMFWFHRAARKLGIEALPAYLVVVSLLVYSLYEGTLYHPYPIAMLALGIAWVLSREGQEYRRG